MPELRRMRPVLGTFVEVAASGLYAAAAIEDAFKALEAAHAAWSFHSPDSELSRVNRLPGERVPVSGRTAKLIRLARAATRASACGFNCALGGELVARGVLPDHGGPRAIRVGSWRDIEVGRRWVRLVRPVRLSLDGIAKGYAVDLAIAALRAAGAQGGCVNAGGDLRVFGTMTRAVHRRQETGEAISLGTLRDAAMATSRVTLFHDSSFPGCVLGAAGGLPVEGLHTVLAATAWRADALTKVAANLPPATRGQGVKRLGGMLVEPPGGASWR